MVGAERGGQAKERYVMTIGNEAISPANNSGAIVRLFGVILIMLGALNSMLAWRGGLELFSFHAALLLAGLLFCLVGAILKHRAVRRL